MSQTTNESLPVLLVVCGPTAVGKTDTAINLAGHFGTEIISCDSRQFYKELRIGVARPDMLQLSMIRHHFMAFLSIHDPYNVYRYEQDALSCLNRLFTKHRIVVMAGGSGLYIHAVCHGIDELPDPDPVLREELKQEYIDGGLLVIRERLRIHDPVYYGQVDPDNPKRILRALEVCLATGKPYSSFRKDQPAKRPFLIIKTGLNTLRSTLYENINRRTDRMIGEGLVDEARDVYPFRHLNAMNTVGYKELFDHFDGHVTLEQAIEKIKTNTRRYAKRQLTWFLKDKELRWFEPGKEKEMIMYVTGMIQRC